MDENHNYVCRNIVTSCIASIDKSMGEVDDKYQLKIVVSRKEQFIRYVKKPET